MKVYSLKSTQLIKSDLDTVWDFFSNPDNLRVITPDYMNFKVLGGNEKAVIYPGQVITYKVSPILKIPVFWMTEITHVVPKKLFVDEQRTGPYKIWHHQHHFEETNNGILMTDIVHYAIPFYIFGQIAHRLFVKRQLDDIFAYRERKVNEIF